MVVNHQMRDSAYYLVYLFAKRQIYRAAPPPPVSSSECVSEKRDLMANWSEIIS